MMSTIFKTNKMQSEKKKEERKKGKKGIANANKFLCRMSILGVYFIIQCFIIKL